MKHLLLAAGLAVSVAGAGRAVAAGAEGQNKKTGNSEPIVSPVTKKDLELRTQSKARSGTVLIQDDAMASFFENRIEFSVRPPDVSMSPRGLIRSGKPVDPREIQPKSILWFQRRFNLLSYNSSEFALVCTNQSLPKIGSRGMDDFCGIISVEGKIIYQFPVRQHSPDKLLRPLAISEDGKYAEVWIGKLVSGEDHPVISEPREVLTWRYPNHLSRFAGPWENGRPKEPYKAFDDLLQGFKVRKSSH